MEKTLLCEHIVHQHFGSHVGRIATLLLEKGRLTLPELIRLSSRTCSAEGHVLLSPHFVRSALAVLIQHNIVWFSRTMTNDAIHRRARAEEFGLMQADHYVAHDSEEYQGTLFYEINSDEIVMRLRFPQFLVLAEKLAEGTSKSLLQVVLAHGKIAIGDLLDIYAQDDPISQSMPICSHWDRSQYGYRERRSLQRPRLDAQTFLHDTNDQISQHESSRSIPRKRKDSTRQDHIRSNDESLQISTERSC